MVDVDCVFHGVHFKLDICSESVIKSSVISPRQRLLTNVQRLCGQRGVTWCDALATDVPRKWEKHSDLVLFSHTSFTNKTWLSLG